MRVLIIEDEPGVARGIEHALRAEGFAVDHRVDGRAGLEAALSGAYDVIVLDILLPSMNGYLICRVLRDAGNWTPVLMLTAKDGEHDEAEGLETGADDYVTKPFHMVVLVARIHALLRRPRFAGTAPFTVGDLRLDPARHMCWRGDVAIELTSREVDVLAQLMTRCEEVVPKALLIENVWGRDFAGDINIVEVYIGHLRRKVDAPFGRDTIETVRGVGYRIGAGESAPAGVETQA